MQYLNYKVVTYVLSETQSLSGKMAYEFLRKILNERDTLLFSSKTVKDLGNTIGLLKQQCKETRSLSNKSSETDFIGLSLAMNEKTLDLLCLLGEYPNYMSISRINAESDEHLPNCLWTIDYCDEMLKFTFIDKLVNGDTLALIENELIKKQIDYERKTIKTIRK